MIPPSLAIVLIATLALTGCAEDDGPQAGEILSNVIVTSFGPVDALARRLAPSDLEVHRLTPDGANPQSFRPDRAVVEDLLMRARLIVIQGAGAEAWRHSIALPDSRLIDTTAALGEDALIEYEYGHDHGEGTEHGGLHSHGGGAHVHTGTYTHTWLDPLLFARQARALAKRMQDLWPKLAAPIEKRLNSLESELEALHSRFAEVAPALRKRPIVATRDLWAYFARRYELEPVVIDLAADHPPAADARAELDKLAKGTMPGLVIWSQSPGEKTRAVLDDLGFQSVVLGSAETAGDGKDCLEVMQDNAQRLHEAVPPPR